MIFCFVIAAAVAVDDVAVVVAAVVAVALVAAVVVVVVVVGLSVDSDRKNADIVDDMERIAFVDRGSGDKNRLYVA